MMFTKKHLITLTIMTGLGLLLAACNLPSAEPPTPYNPDLIGTAAAATVSANLTQAASGNFATPTAPIQPTDTQAVNPPVMTATPNGQTPVSSAPSPTSQPLPTSTQAPPTPTQGPPSPTPIPCDRASFVPAGETYKDGTEVLPGTSFVKTWRLRNTGSCTWNASYSVVFISGDALNAPASVQLTTGSVAPGQEVDVSVTMRAPETSKEYTGHWKLRNAEGVVFGLGANAEATFWVKIKVASPTPTSHPPTSGHVALNFVEQAPLAQWRNGTNQLPWGDPGPDDDGVAAHSQQAKLNDGKTYPIVLATFPQQINNGVITGLFPEYTVQNGDLFIAKLGFLHVCRNGKAKFQLNYVEGSSAPQALAEWSKSCDDNLLPVWVDLAPLKGRTVRLMLAVHTDGAWEHDFAVWLEPRVER
jgi:hypothetical protein